MLISWMLLIGTAGATQLRLNEESNECGSGQVCCSSSTFDCSCSTDDPDPFDDVEPRDCRDTASRFACSSSWGPTPQIQIGSDCKAIAI